MKPGFLPKIITGNLEFEYKEIWAATEKLFCFKVNVAHIAKSYHKITTKIEMPN